MAEELLPVLMRFHREVLLPDLERIIGDAFGGLRAEMNERFNEIDRRFDAIHQRFDRLEATYRHAGQDCATEYPIVGPGARPG